MPKPRTREKQSRFGVAPHPDTQVIRDLYLYYRETKERCGREEQRIAAEREKARLGCSPTALAKKFGVTIDRVNSIIRELQH